ncbi:MAG: T9SS type A sorting domain-containing protein [Melioribacteraceae bacterium]|nr:T9SS type A sorting domain-containing protein [Melioribacteraceae bacterium]MCF8353418.1 T9SS type A sorting domain-containing protein [Melioribacteraceae bacterium]MCF8418979.1 T9SS type A sorting domain-containing protein [Melioribacteraceae bacterium]
MFIQKKLLYLVCMLSITIILSAQQSILNEDMPYKISWDFNNDKNLSDKAIDTTTIFLADIDTSLYSSKYLFHSRVNVSMNSFRTITIADFDNDNQTELYGRYVLLSKGLVSYNFVMEYDSLEEVFKEKYVYQDTIGGMLGVFSAENSDIPNRLMASTMSTWLGYAGYVYKQPAPDSLPTELDFIYRPNVQFNNPTFGDFDKNGIQDMVYVTVGSEPTVVRIVEYNEIKNNFDTTFTYDYEDLNWSVGFSVKDIDNDGYEEIVFGDPEGKVEIIEYDPSSGYRVTWQSYVSTYNIYHHIATNDINKNGFKEFWVGGDAYYNGVPITRFTCFEAIGDNSYLPVHIIDIVGVFSFWAGNSFAIDIDKDGTEELFICVDQRVIILKFTGNSNQHNYEIYYYKKNPRANNGGKYFGATMYDMDNDGWEEIFINQGQTVDGVREDFSIIYTPDVETDVKEKVVKIPDEYELYQNYPNPFNPTTNIVYQLPKEGRVVIKLYDILGREIQTLVNEFKTQGRYEFTFDGSKLSSGVYIYRITSGEFSASKKFVLMQ